MGSNNILFRPVPVPRNDDRVLPLEVVPVSGHRHRHGVTFQMKATEPYLPVVLFIMMCRPKVILTFESVDEILKCDHSN